MNQPKKITLTEIRNLVKQIIKEEFEGKKNNISNYSDSELYLWFQNDFPLYNIWIGALKTGNFSVIQNLADEKFIYNSEQLSELELNFQREIIELQNEKENREIDENIDFEEESGTNVKDFTEHLESDLYEADKKYEILGEGNGWVLGRYLPSNRAIFAYVPYQWTNEKGFYDNGYMQFDLISEVAQSYVDIFKNALKEGYELKIVDTPEDYYEIIIDKKFISKPSSNIKEEKVASGINITVKEFEKMLKDNNEKYGMDFSLGGAYGQYELWAKGHRLEAGSLKDVYNTFVKYRFNEKYKK